MENFGEERSNKLRPRSSGKLRLIMSRLSVYPSAAAADTRCRHPPRLASAPGARRGRRAAGSLPGEATQPARGPGGWGKGARRPARAGRGTCVGAQLRSSPVGDPRPRCASWGGESLGGQLGVTRESGRGLGTPGLISINGASIPLTFKVIKLFPTRF